MCRAERPGAGPPVRVLFVGGDESQARYHAGIEAAVTARYRGTVTVEWWAPGWSSNWAPVADAVERRYPGAGALVLMTFVRTNFGRRMRATSGGAGVPWVSCTGHGRTAMDRAIDRAVAVARR